MDETIVYPKARVSTPSRPSADLAQPWFYLSNLEDDAEQEITLDFGRCEGGLPVFQIESAVGPESQVSFRATYSETRAGIDHEKGDGPFFLFSSAMDSYRSCIHHAFRGDTAQQVVSRHVQYSQRYLKVSLVLPQTSIRFSSVGFQQVRPTIPTKCHFSCSEQLLNDIWRDGVRTLDKCTVRRGETKPAWDVTPVGTRVYAGHWAPCRQGTQWTDVTINFEVKVENGGASWGVHMVANGLVLCLDTAAWTLAAFEGLSNQSSLMPARPRGSWPLPVELSLSDWITVTTVAKGESVIVLIGGFKVAEINDVRIRSILAADRINSGSVALGGPEGWVSTYRNLQVSGLDGVELYSNSMTTSDSARVLADFQVGTNSLACTIDGAKRDRACFGGDVFVMGRSLAYSTADLEAWSGSIRLLTSHQTPDGYLGNLSPIQTPEHDEGEPPTYAFYSLTYALLLAVSCRDYWMHSGDEKLRAAFWQRLDRLICFADRFTGDHGLIEAPPHLQMTWFPMGGPVIGISASLNLAYHDALGAMAEMSFDNSDRQSWYQSRAGLLRDSLIARFWNSRLAILRMGSNLPEDGFCQDVNAYALTQDLLPSQTKVVDKLTPSPETLPPAFEHLGHWDRAGIASPYATGMAVEALFSSNRSRPALDLIRSVWGVMADRSSADYSGAHWEAMKLDGSPFNHDVSLAHGWSTWPVFLLPRFLLGLYPRTAGWKQISIEPVLADLDKVEGSVATPAGEVCVSVTLDKTRLAGEIRVTVPVGAVASIALPSGWQLQGAAEICGGAETAHRRFSKRYVEEELV